MQLLQVRSPTFHFPGVMFLMNDWSAFFFICPVLFCFFLFFWVSVKETRAEGRKEGRKEGRNKGRMEGWKDGRMEGRKQARKEGGTFAQPTCFLFTDRKPS